MNARPDAFARCLRQTRRLPSAALIALALGIAGCAAIPPDRNPLPQRDIARAQLAADIKLAQGGWPGGRWWTQYGDPQLNRLVERALKNGPSLALAATRIGSAQAVLAASDADRGPKAGLTAAASRQRYSANGLFPAPIGGNYFSETTIRVQASTDLDWWGRHRAQIAAALGEVDARRAEYAQARQTLAAAVAQTYFKLQAGLARLANTRSMVAAQGEVLAAAVARVDHGLAAIDEERVAEAGLAALKQQLALLEAQVAAEREALRALLGAGGNALAELAPRPLPDVPDKLPSRLGMELLARRPDLQAARWRIEAALSRIDAARAAFYPDINLAGAFGLDALSLGNLFKAASATPFVGPTLSLPLFDAKRLDARLAATRSERDEMIADYNQKVFDAVRDIAELGVRLRGIEAAMAQQAAEARASDALLQAAQARFKQGLAARDVVLAARLDLFKQRDAGLQLRDRQLSLQVSLVEALGGGYRTDSTGMNAQASK